MIEQMGRHDPPVTSSWWKCAAEAVCRIPGYQMLRCGALVFTLMSAWTNYWINELPLIWDEKPSHWFFIQPLNVSYVGRLCGETLRRHINAIALKSPITRLFVQQRATSNLYHISDHLWGKFTGDRNSLTRASCAESVFISWRVSDSFNLRRDDFDNFLTCNRNMYIYILK